MCYFMIEQILVNGRACNDLGLTFPHANSYSVLALSSHCNLLEARHPSCCVVYIGVRHLNAQVCHASVTPSTDLHIKVVGFI